MGVREIPARRPHADDADEVGGRGDGHWPHLQGIVHESVSLARARCERPAHHPPDGRRRVGRGRDGVAAGIEHSQRPADVGDIPRARSWLVGRRAARADEDRPLVPDAVLADCRAVPLGQPGRAARHVDGSPPHAEAGRVERSGPRDDPRHRRRGDSRPARRARARHRLQAHRYLRGRVRVVHAVSLRHLREGVRGRSDAEAEGRHPRQRAEPHRAGARVRLLLLSRGVRAARRRLRNGHDQLQPRDRFDRLRHRRPPVLRAADVRGRLGHHRA